jgi:CDP-6-deoxy-D-xylo-4-hexulose-3-dehydrase
MIKLVSDTIDRDDINALIDWLKQEPIPKLTKGELTIELEKRWAKKVGTKYSVFVNSGSSAILLLLAALKEQGVFSKNKKIAVPSLSWLTDVSSPLQLGLNPVLVDCNLEDLSVDLSHLEQVFIKEKPAAMILVHVLGLVPKMNDLVELCRKYGVLIVEDVCESMGSKYKGKPLGNSNMTVGSVYSTYFGHHISTIEGGFINCNDSDLYHLLLALRSHGWDRDLPKNIQKTWRSEWEIEEFDALYTFYYPGFNLRSTDLQAFIGLRQIEKLDRFAQRRQENFKIYQENISDNLLNVQHRKGDFISNFAYPVVHKERASIVKDLKKIGVEVRPLIAGSMAEKPFWKGKKPKMPNCELINKFGFYLPNHQDLSEEDILKICEIINYHSLPF